MNMPPAPFTGMQQKVDQAIAEISTVVLGKTAEIRLALCCLFAGGHLLLEDKPGMGKTTLSQALAATFGLGYRRIQFTSDLLPADIIGVSIYEPQHSSFRFHQGPVFSNLVLADEINRTTPKTQSALLEAMEEGRVTVDGVTHDLPQPFFVIATQNPLTHSGTFPLPESQLDRFLMRLSLGYPDATAERRLLQAADQRAALTRLRPTLDIGDIQTLQLQLAQVHASDSLLDYVQRLVAFSRREGEFAQGLSPRGAQALMRSARTWALMQDRRHLLPEDIQAVLAPVMEHRLRAAAGIAGKRAASAAQRLLCEVDVF